MSIFIPNEFERSNSYSPIGSVGEIIFYGSISLLNNFSTQQVLPLVISGPTPLNLNRLNDGFNAYFSIKWLTISSRKSPSFADKHRASVFETGGFASIPVGASNQTVTFNAANGANLDPTFFARIALGNFPAANFTVSDAKIRVHNAATFLSLLYTVGAPVGASGAPPILLSQYFDPLDGFLNFDPANPGFDLNFVFSNTGSSPATGLVYYFYGSRYAYDWLQMLIRYQDWRGRLYNVGVFDDRAASQPFQLGQRVPIPIEDPNMANFGQITFDNLGFNSFFNNSYTYDVTAAGTIEYLPPNAA